MKNIQSGILPNFIIAPPRDAIPLASSLGAMADVKGQSLHIFELPVNRNTAGISNNQKNSLSQKSPHLEQMFDQAKSLLHGSKSVAEIETGIYGTTSLVMASALKSRDVQKYYPLKIYGLGPNLSFIHAVLSHGKEWIAQNAETLGLVNKKQIDGLMVLLDTMEELGMEKFYQSVETLMVDADGRVLPVKVPVTKQELEVATLTNLAIVDTAPLYANISIEQLTNLLDSVPKLVKCSQDGFPFTLTKAIPSMDSKEAHFQSIRTSKLFDYPLLQL